MAQGLGHGKDIVLVARVVVVAEEEGRDPWRGRAQEGAGGRVVLDRGLQAVGVEGRGLHVAHAHRAVAGRCLAMLAARVGEHLGLGVGISLDVLEHEAVARAAKAVETVLHVGGVAGFGHLTVVDDVQAGLDLPGGDVGHGLGDLHFDGFKVQRNAVFAGEHDLHQFFLARKAADVGGQKSVVAAHGVFLMGGSEKLGLSRSVAVRAVQRPRARRRVPAG